MEYQSEYLKIALCDDEKYIHEVIEKELEDYGKERGMISELVHFYSGKELLEAEQEPDILLLDIEMPEMDGIEAAKQLRAGGFEAKIIMLTSKIERFKEAFKIGAFRFVTKPLDKAELFEALDEVRERMYGQQSVKVYRNGLEFEVQQKEIMYIEAKPNNVLVYTGQADYTSPLTLKGWQEQLDTRLFFYCHRSYIINLNYVQELQKGEVLLQNGERVAVARRRYTDLLRAFMEFDTGRG